MVAYLLKFYVILGRRRRKCAEYVNATLSRGVYAVAAYAFA